MSAIHVYSESEERPRNIRYGPTKTQSEIAVIDSLTNGDWKRQIVGKNKLGS